MISDVDKKPLSLNDQFTLLSSISNYHWWQYIGCDGDISCKSFHVNLHEHLFYHPSCDISDDNLRQKHLPKSPRNRFMYYILNGDIYPGAEVATLKHLLKIDNGEFNQTHGI